MKTQLIILEQGNIIVSDEILKDKDKILVNGKTYNNEICEFRESTCPPPYVTNRNVSKKIIAGLENQPTINYSALSDEDCEKIGYINVENYSKLEFPPDFNVQGDELDYYERMAFIKGFKKAQSLNDKKFSLEDIIVIREMLVQGALTNMSCSSAIVELGKIIQSLQEPKVFDIEVEVEQVKCLTNKYKNQPKNTIGFAVDYKYESQPKIINNSIKITKIL